jgi:hypothetical protein
LERLRQRVQEPWQTFAAGPSTPLNFEALAKERRAAAADAHRPFLEEGRHRREAADKSAAAPKVR